MHDRRNRSLYGPATWSPRFPVSLRAAPQAATDSPNVRPTGKTFPKREPWGNSWSADQPALAVLEMCHEPVSSRRRSELEILDVGIEVTSGEHNELLRLERPLVGGQRLVNYREVVTQCHDQEKRRRAEKADVGTWLILGEHLDRAQCHLIAPGRSSCPTGLGEPRPGIRRRQRGGRKRILGNDRDHGRGFPRITVAPIIVEHAVQAGPKVRSDQPPRVIVAADQGHLPSHAFNPAVDRADDQHVTPAIAGSPDTNAIYVGLRKCLGERDRIAVITDLLPGVDFLARLATARAKVPIVEYQCAEAGCREYLGKFVQVHLLHS